MSEAAAPPSSARLRRSQESLDRFEHVTEIPMIVLSVLFLAALTVPVIDTRLSPAWRHSAALTDTAVWVVFAVEYAIRLWLAPRRLRFIAHNVLDGVVVVVPVLRPLRIARLARFARLGALAARSGQRSRQHLHTAVAVQVVTVAVLLVFVGAVGVLDVERNAPGSNIHTLGDAMWWALSTITTVGYGDKYPVTGQGRLIAAGLMITGIAVLGVITAAVAGWFVDNLQEIRATEASESDKTADLQRQLSEVLDRLARIETRLTSSEPSDRQ